MTRFECNECGWGVFVPLETAVDGDVFNCSDCGKSWMLSCDAESDPYLVDPDA